MTAVGVYLDLRTKFLDNTIEAEDIYFLNYIILNEYLYIYIYKYISNYVYSFQKLESQKFARTRISKIFINRGTKYGVSIYVIIAIDKTRIPKMR